MISPFDLGELLYPALMILFLGFLISYYFTRSLTASFGLSAYKCIFFLVYFGFLFDGKYTQQDDWGYISHALSIVNQGYTGWELLTQEWDRLVHIFRNWHFLYYLINILAFEAFGFEYFAPVAVNAVFIFLISGLTLRIAHELNLSSKRSIFLYSYLCLHWDFQSWGGIMNLKDTTVVLLTSLLFLQLIRVSNSGWTTIRFFWILVGIVLLNFVRFYVPYLILGCWVLYIFLQRLIESSFQRKVIVFCTFFPVLGLALVSLSQLLEGELGFLLSNFSNPATGTIRFLLTPIPFGTQPHTEFLDIPAFLHWCSVPMILGALALGSGNRLKKQYRYLLLYFLTILFLYGCMEVLQGPRHRYQLVFIIALLQLAGLKYWLDKVRKRLGASVTRRKPKVLIITPSMKGGGAEKVLSLIVNSLDLSKFKVVILVLNSVNEAFPINQKNGQLKLLSYKHKSVKQGLGTIIKVIYSEKPTLVFSIYTHLSVMIQLLKPILPSGIKYIARETAIASMVPHIHGLKGVIYARLYQFVYGKLDCVIAQSKFMKDDLIQHFNVAPFKITVINNPVDHENIEKLANCEESGNVSSHYVSVGRLVPVKRYDLLIQAFADPKLGSFSLDIVGDGPEREKLQSKIDELSLSNRVRLLGFQENPHRIVGKARALILTSLFEGFPNVVLEANAQGIPVVAMNMPGGIAEIVEQGVNGWLVENDSLESLVQGILRAESHSWNSEEIVKHSKSKYALDQILKQYEDCFEAELFSSH